MSNIFLIPFHVTATECAITPIGSAGGTVCCYAGELSLESAIANSIASLKSDGIVVQKILDPIKRMDSSQWALHVDDTWPEHACSMCTQEEFELALGNGEIVYGPFGVYNPC